VARIFENGNEHVGLTKSRKLTRKGTVSFSRTVPLHRIRQLILYLSKYGFYVSYMLVKNRGL
jgi:hypothetical protein